MSPEAPCPAEGIPSPKPIRVVFAEDHRSFSENLQSLFRLEPQHGIEIVAITPSGTEVVSLARELQPDVVMIDLTLSEGSGLEAIRTLHGIDSSPPILVLSENKQKGTVHQAVHAGALGYISKLSGMEEIAKAIEKVSRCEPHFDVHAASSLVEIARDFKPRPSLEDSFIKPEELALWKRLCQGYTVKEIAHMMGKPPTTLYSIQDRLMRHVRVQSSFHLLALGIHLGVSSPDERGQ